MRKLSLTQLVKTGLAFTTVSATTIDAGLLFADRVDWLAVKPEWYVNAPLAVWTLVGIPISISLAERMLQQITAKPGQITTHLDDRPTPTLRAISFHANGKRDTLLASVAPFLFADKLPHEGERLRPPVLWKVPIEDTLVTVREGELRAFLDVAAKRSKYQFSRNYWVQTRKPPLLRAKYEAMMRLLVEARLVEDRQNGASGRLVTKPHHALTYLKFESCYAIKRG